MSNVTGCKGRKVDRQEEGILFASQKRIRGGLKRGPFFREREGVTFVGGERKITQSFQSIGGGQALY